LRGTSTPVTSKCGDSITWSMRMNGLIVLKVFSGECPFTCNCASRSRAAIAR
jgi:hypothetical protein